MAKPKKGYEKPEIVDLSGELLGEGAPTSCIIYGGSASTGTCSGYGGTAPGGSCIGYGGAAYGGSCLVGNYAG